MITEIVTFKLPAGMGRAEAVSNFEHSVQTWRDNPDLIRKNYLFDAEAGIGGGVYLWNRREDAEKWHGEAFRLRVKSVYGSEPESRFFETPIVVDNVAGEVSRD